MTDRPILFSGPMVNALLAGRKTQTRRVINFAGVDKVIDFVRVAFNKDSGVPIYEMKDAAGTFLSQPKGEHFVDYHYSPRFAVGDRLYVRETWAPLDRLMHNDPGVTALLDNGFYQADNSTVGGEISRWTPAIHMPRQASRLTLTVSEVRVQRLQDISETDAVAEGCYKGKVTGRVFANELAMHLGGDQWANARDWYADLWDRLNEKRGFGWQTNPWVVAVTFSVERRNIDQAAP